MRTIKFNPEEIKTLEKIIVLGEYQYENYFGETSIFIIKKMKSNFHFFENKEVQLLKSYTVNWIDNHEKNIDKLRVKFLLSKNPKYNDIPESEKELLRIIGTVFAIKSKLFREKYINFKEVLEKI